MQRFFVAAAAGILASAATPALAQGFPTRPLVMVVPFAAGGPTDTLARIMAERMGRALKQTMVVENTVGAAGTIGVGRVARANPDGYTLLVAPTSTLTVNPAVYAKLGYDPQKDFVPVTQLSSYQLYLTVNAGQPIKTVAELVAHAKAHPEKANLGSPSTVFELITAMFAARAGIKFETIPFKSTAETMTALLTDQVMIAFQDYNSLAQQLKAGKVRLLATTGTRRSTDLPDVPTFAEAGYPGIELEPLTGIVAPKATPTAIVTKLQTEIRAILATPDVAERFRTISMTPIGNTSQEFSALIDREIKRWTEVAKAANIKLEQ